MKNRIAVCVMSAALVAAASPWVIAQTSSAKTGTGDSQSLAVPKTPEEHAARAAFYKDKAATYRQEAETHRKMFAEYERTQGNPALQNKAGRELPWVAQMRKHCEAYMKDAEKLAAEADRFAEFHRMLAEEAKSK